MNLKEILKDKVAKKRQLLVTFAIFLVFFLLRLYRLGHHDLWYDEAGTLSYAQYPWGNWNAPLYWILLHYWIKIFGISEFSLRLPSAVFSFLSVIIVFILGKELFDKKTGIIASFFMGLSPFHLWYAQEARDYSMVLFFGLLSSWLLYKSLKVNKKNLWLFFVLASIVGFYTNYFYIFLFLAQFLYTIFFGKTRINFRKIFCFLIIAMGFLPYLNRFLNKFYYVWAGFWVPEPNIKSLVITIENFVLGYNGFAFLYFLSNCLVLIFCISALRNMRKKDLKQNLTFCIFLFFIPIASIFLFSKIFFSIYLDRALIIFSPYFYLILSLGIISLNRNYKTRVSLIVIFIIFFIGINRYYRDQVTLSWFHRVGAFVKKPFKPIVKFIENNLGEEDIIAVTNLNPPITPSLRFYSRKFKNYYFFFDPEMIEPNFQRPIVETRLQVPIYKINNLKYQKLWLIASDGGERSGGLDENSLAVKEWLDNNAILKLSREFDGLWVFLYER